MVSYHAVRTASTDHSRWLAVDASRWFRTALSLISICWLSWASPASATGGSPADPRPFNVASGPLSLHLSAGEEIWLRMSFAPASHASHLVVETTGSTDTFLAAYVDLPDALAETPLATDDDSGQGLNALVTLPLGFSSPMLLRVSGFSSSTTGPLQIRGELTFHSGERCDWPAGCPLATSAQGEPSARDMLRTLRRTRSEILSQTPRGRDLIELYWRLGRDLTPNLLLHGDLRREIYHRVMELLPLADGALAANLGESELLFSSVHLRKLQELSELLSSQLENDLRDELETAWRAFPLEARHVGQPLSTILAETGLLPVERQSATVIFKLRQEPELKRRSAKNLLLVGNTEIDALLDAADVRTLRRVHRDTAPLRAAGLTRTIAIETRDRATAERLVAALAASPAVQWAEVSAEARIFAPPPGEDPYRAELWGLDAIEAPAAWNRETGDCSTLVAIIDTGFRPGLADVEGRLRQDLGRDFAEQDSDPYDGHGHGTHVGGTVAAAAGNSTSIAGVAPDVCIFAVKVLTDEGDGSFEAVAEGVAYAADAGASVINLSLGCDCETQQVLEDALAYAASRNVVIVAASGNDSLNYLGYPASSPYAIAVGAIDSNLELASFSNYGPGQDLVAPGVDVISLFPDGESCSGSGTSMAAPHVAGVAALIRSQDPSLGREEVRQRLREGARDLGAPGWDERFGAGLVNANNVVDSDPGDPCSGEDCMRLQRQRFEVRVNWRDFAGNTGSGHVAPFGSDDSGLLWFFDASNWEMLIKVLDGCGINQSFWVFAAATTNVEYTLYITDTATGATKTYFNPLGTASPALTDTSAFATCSAASSGVAPLVARASDPLFQRTRSLTEKSPAGACPGGDDHLCLNQRRFRVDVTWRDFAGNTGIGNAVPYGSDDSGLLWFFLDSNWEMLVKVLDGCAINGQYWVFAAATTNVEYTLRVTDTVTGRVSEYRNPLGRAAPTITDTSGFACSP